MYPYTPLTLPLFRYVHCQIGSREASLPMDSNGKSSTPHPYSSTLKKLYVLGRSAGLDARPIPEDSAFPSAWKKAAWLDGCLSGRMAVEVRERT